MPVYLDTRGNSVLSVGICDRCNRKFAYTELMPDPNFPGMRVCKDDVDNFDPWRLPALQTENIALRFPRPDVSIALEPTLLDTEGDPNNFVQFNQFFIEGVPPAAGAQGDLNTNGNLGNPIDALNPFIYGVAPSNGPQAGGTTVLITGSNFTNVQNVKFGGVNAASFTIIDSTQISAVTPAYLTTGIVDVSAISSFGSGVYHGGFTYN